MSNLSETEKLELIVKDIENKINFAKRIDNPYVSIKTEYLEYILDRTKFLEKTLLDIHNSRLDFGTLYDFLITSVDEENEPKWTEEHIEELLDNFNVRFK